MRQYVNESHKKNNKNVSRILEDVVLADCYNGLWVFWENYVLCIYVCPELGLQTIDLLNTTCHIKPWTHQVRPHAIYGSSDIERTSHAL